MPTVKKVMSYPDAVHAWAKVTKWPFSDEEVNDDGESEVVNVSTPSTPLAFYYMNDPTDRLVILNARIASDDGEAVIGFYPVGQQWFSIAPASITESPTGIMIDTLSRDKDCVVRPLEKEDAIWAIGRAVDTIAELHDELETRDI